ncbi:MAG: hypothetical protein U0790_22765 [Isosphaeraceae bacterium]
MTADTTTPAGPAPSKPEIGPGRDRLDLLLVSFVALFLELACIRWFSSTVIFLTFFTNLVLMACFLGLCVGCLAARRRRHYLEGTIPLALLTMALAVGLLWIYNRYDDVMVDVGSQARPDQIYFGTEFRSRDLAAFVIPLEAIAGVFFALISLTFIGVGQTLGRALDRFPNRVEAYTLNLAGSLAGILGFGAISLLRAPPAVWFALALAPVVVLVRRRAMRWLSGAAALLIVVGLGLLADLPDGESPEGSATYWSPYYKIRFEPRGGKVFVNNILHQVMSDLSRDGYLYHVPHLMNRDAGGPPFRDVLVIGAGTGNDVVGALAHGAGAVDAVEIDPVLYEIGRESHPNRHGADARVSPRIDDGRSVVRSTTKKYDLIVYALVDSLVLHSGYSSIRLESFLFTEQAFRDLKERLKPGGMLVLYNLYRQGWVVGRLAELARRTFGVEPIVLSLPHQDVIKAEDNQGNRLTFLLAGTPESAALRSMRERLARDRFYWIHPSVRHDINGPGYGPDRPFVPGTSQNEWFPLGPAVVQTEGVGALPTDDFPFLYLREPRIPGLNLRGMAIVGILSLVILWRFAPVGTTRPNGQMFFLGAGFMLLETKGVVHLALLFGSTWMVNSIVFAAILLMALLSNLYVLRFRPRRIWPYYLLLLASLLVNLVVPMTSFLDLPGAFRVPASCLVVFVPIFFAGIIFATAFRDSAKPDVDFGSNIGGVILGGLSENLSLVFGFNNLLFLAIGYYALSACLARRGPA